MTLTKHYVDDTDARVMALLQKMTTAEKLGQMNQLNGSGGHVSEELASAIRAGHVGSVINEVDSDTIDHLQHLAKHESRLGIPLLIGRDVIHGFNTVFPIPLGFASSWSEPLVERIGRVSAVEASSVGINWTFSPMIDIARDPRWGRIAESFGEDPVLCSTLGAAMVRGYQSKQLSNTDAIAACAKHFAAYGASESGRDYNTTNVSEHDMRQVYLPPFKAACEAGAATFMTSFSDINGIPASANKWLLNDILREEWQFTGVVVSDWESVQQLTTHGLAEFNADAAALAINAGVDMEMVSQTYVYHGDELLAQQRITMQQLNKSVSRILAVKFALGLFDCVPVQRDTEQPQDALDLAYEAAVKSCVLLTNNQNVLPLQQQNMDRLAVFGPLADDEYEQLGTWIFDGDISLSQTLIQGLTIRLDNVELDYLPVFAHSRDQDCSQIQAAVDSALQSDAVILCLGEESILSGEAHCRAELSLPGAQQQLIEALHNALSQQSIPLVLVVLAGRPLVLENVVDKVDAILYAWHPGSMGGPAIADLLLGYQNPSAKTPVSFVRKVGQIPLYYAQKRGGRPVTHDNYVSIDEFPMRAAQTSLGMSAAHMDTYFTPLFPFGFGLSYSTIAYQNLQLDKHEISLEEVVSVTVDVTNHGPFAKEEIVQLYVCDTVASLTRPVKELKHFQRIALDNGESQQVTFKLNKEDLFFYNAQGKAVVEAGHFQVWVGGDSNAELTASFRLTESGLM